MGVSFKKIPLKWYKTIIDDQANFVKNFFILVVLKIIGGPKTYDTKLVGGRLPSKLLHAFKSILFMN